MGHRRQPLPVLHLALQHHAHRHQRQGLQQWRQHGPGGRDADRLIRRRGHRQRQRQQRGGRLLLHPQRCQRSGCQRRHRLPGRQCRHRCRLRRRDRHQRHPGAGRLQLRRAPGHGAGQPLGDPQPLPGRARQLCRCRPGVPLVQRLLSPHQQRLRALPGCQRCQLQPGHPPRLRWPAQPRQRRCLRHQRHPPAVGRRQPQRGRPPDLGRQRRADPQHQQWRQRAAGGWHRRRQRQPDPLCCRHRDQQRGRQPRRAESHRRHLEPGGRQPAQLQCHRLPPQPRCHLRARPGR